MNERMNKQTDRLLRWNALCILNVYIMFMGYITHNYDNIIPWTRPHHTRNYSGIK